jgi:sortase A
VAAGLAIVGYVAWQLIGTNIVSERRQTELVEQLQGRWSTQPGTELSRADPVRLGEASALIRIPRFGDDYVMPVLEGVGEDELSSGFGHFLNSAGPGRKGNYALAAHRVTHGEPLRDMPSLRPGDTVIVETRGMVNTYEIDTDPNQLVVDLSEVWVLAAQPLNPRTTGVQPDDDPRLLTLVTCAELFHTDDRMVVFGHLVARQPR